MSKSILIVDDSPTNLQLTSLLLVSHGYDVHTAADGPQALRMLDSLTPDLILMDLQLPGIDGLEVTRRLKADARRAHIPVVALTAYAMSGDDEKAYAAGCQGYITKPIDTRAFPIQIREHLDRSAGAAAPRRTIATVLVAEDDPVQKKLMEVRLGKEGYVVTSASDGAEALRKARNERPDLVLSDILMPRLDGFRLCQAIRSSIDLEKTHVVLTTSGSIQESDEALASRMGATAFVLKSEDCREILDALVRASKLDPRNPALIGDGIESLRRTFLEEAKEQMETLLASERQGLNVKAARRVAHRWAGTGGTLGFPEISRLAFSLERELERSRPDRAALTNLLGELSGLFQNAEKERTHEMTIPAFVRAALSSGKIAVAGFGPAESRRIAHAVERAGSFVRVLDRLPEADDASDLYICHVDLLHSPGGIAGGPLLVIGPAESFESVGNIPGEFLVEPVDDSEIVLRVYRLLTRPTPRAPTQPRRKNQTTVLLADDDPTILVRLEATFRNSDIRCYTASSGSHVLPRAVELRPDGIILDVNLPEMGGFEVLSALKHDARTKDIPVMVLTARQEEPDILRAFSLGTDEYVVKPFSPMEVLARLQRLLRQ